MLCSVKIAQWFLLVFETPLQCLQTLRSQRNIHISEQYQAQQYCVHSSMHQNTIANLGEGLRRRAGGLGLRLLRLA